MAILIGWKREYSIDNGLIDQQHKQLLELANHVLAINDPVAEVAELRDNVKELFHYMEYHFDAEEQFMKEMDYPDLEQHQAIHAQLVHDMNQLLKSARDYAELLQSLKPVMKSWVLKHIQEEDSKIGIFLKEKELAGSQET